MTGIAQMMQDGGSFMFLIVLLGLGGAIAALGLALGRIMLPRLFAVPWLIVPTATLLAGAYGTNIARGATADAVERASPEIASVLAAQGTSVATYPMIFALIVAASTLVSSSVLCGIGGTLGLPDGASRRMPLAHPSLATLLVVPVAGWLSGWPAALASSLTAIGLILAAVPVMGNEEDGAEDDARHDLSAHTLTIGAMSTFGLMCGAAAASTTALMQHYSIIARASADTQAALLASIAASPVYDPTGWLIAAAATLGLTLATVSLRGVWPSSTRHLLDGGAFAFLVVCSSVAILGVSLSM